VILVDFSGTLAKHREVVRTLFDKVDYPFFKNKGFEGGEEELRDVFREVNRRIRSNENKQGDFTYEVSKVLDLGVSRAEAVEKEETFDSKYTELIKPIDGAVEGLRKLLEIDDLVLLTNGACRRVIPAVEKLGFEGFFKQIICLGGTGKNKSQGELFEKLKRMGAWVIIGDNPRKDGMAENYGIQFIDVRVGWPTAARLVKGLRSDRMRLKA
jgi:FMN phosphatase YigB (HAD superfamily)